MGDLRWVRRGHWTVRSCRTASVGAGQWPRSTCSSRWFARRTGLRRASVSQAQRGAARRRRFVAVAVSRVQQEADSGRPGLNNMARFTGRKESNRFCIVLLVRSRDNLSNSRSVIDEG